MIQEILKSLALENRRLTIPTIGAFLLNPQKQVRFSSFLKYDDGLFIKLLSERKNIPEEHAKQIIQDFTHDVLNVISNGGRYNIPNFGYFTKDDKNNIDFVFEDTNEAFGVKETGEPEPVSAPNVPSFMDTMPVFGNAEQKPQNAFDFSNIFIPPAADTAPPIKEKKNNAGYWILTALLIIIALLLLLYLFSNNFKQTVNSLFGSKPKVEVKADTVIIVADTVKAQLEDTVVIKQENMDTQTALASTPTSTLNGKYQVIAGCYLDRRIAENFAAELKSDGYDARVPANAAGEWYIVMVYESNDMQDAIRVKDSFVDEGYEDAWVRIRPGRISANAATDRQAQSYSNAGTAGKTGSKYQTVAGCFIEEKNGEKLADELKSRGFNVTVKFEGEWTVLILNESNDLNEANQVKDQCIAAGYDAWVRTR
ncbi:MAG: hypothetical protein LBJ63_00890 [Prevotellaceae bacterium]|jgi:nucleoid DNA-binding protein/cell division protein FtsN|nr:hypothetical protein [Prevotellaceae bacterium]